LKRLLRLCLMAVWTMLAIALSHSGVWAQQTDSIRLEEIRAKDIKTQNDILEGNSVQNQSNRDKQFYQGVKRFFSKTKLLRGMYSWLFREPGKGPDATEENRVKSVDPHKKYDGKIVGKVEVKRIEVFGPNVNDTLRLPQNWLERTGNNLHVNTRGFLIRNNYLLFGPGSTVDHQVIQNNERILRTALPNLLDARIYVVPRADNKDTVDILVVTQDVWSISVDGSFGSLESGNLNIEDKNILGLGHTFRQGFSYLKNRNQPWGYRGRYTVPYIGRTYISAEGEYISDWGNRVYALRLRKPFLAPSIKYGGGIELSYNKITFPVFFPIDTVNLGIPVKYKLADFWLGRAFRFYRGTENFQKSARFILAGRLVHYDFYQGPEIKPDTNQYQGRTTGLFSVGFNRRNYFRDVYIYGFGRTEDVPYGSLFNLTFGIEKTQFIGNRLYSGVNWVYAQYYPHFGYLYSNFNIGSYRRNDQWEQGAIDFNVKYFSPLMGQRKLKIRQFVNARYRKGINRFYNEGIDISNNEGIRGIESLVLNLETVFFMPGNLLGFRFAFFGYADIGYVARPDNQLLSRAPLQGYGIGIRIRNEHLAFNTFQLRIGYYANIPDNSTLFRGDTAGFPSLRLSDMAITAPDVVPFRW